MQGTVGDQRRRPGFARRGLVLAALLTLFAGSAAAAPLDAWDIEASVDADAGAIDGTFAWTVYAQEPLHELQLFRYPAAYAQDPDLDDLLRPRVYPTVFEPADQSLADLVFTWPDGRSESVVAEPIAGPIPRWRIALPAPLTGAGVLAGRFTTAVPRKYGTFGRHRGVLTLNGGLRPLPVDRRDGVWLPDAAPPETAITLRLSGAPKAVVAGVTPGADGVYRTQARWLTVSVDRDGRRWDIPVGDPLSSEPSGFIVFHGRELYTGQKRWLRRAAENAWAVLQAAGFEPPSDVVIVEAPLRRKLVELGDGVILVSDRYLEVDRIFWRYHDVHLARALIAAAIEDRVRQLEDPRDADFVLDGVSWAMVEPYLRERWKNHINLRTFVENFRFIPQVDQLLETPAFPFADQVFDNPNIADPLQADIRRFNRPLRTGRMLFMELEDLVGRDSLQQAVRAWLGGDRRPFPQLLSERTGVQAGPWFERWLGPVPRVNLRVAEVRRERADGLHVTTITVERQTLEGTAPPEPVEVRVESARPGKRGRITLRWEGDEATATWQVTTPYRLGAVKLDPRGRVLENDVYGLSVKKDNRAPRTVTLTGYGYFFAVNTSGVLEAYGVAQLRPQYDLQHHVLARVFANQQTRVGGGLSYVHYFGQPRLGTYRRHRVVGSLDLQWLNPAFAPTDAPLLIEGRASWIYDDRTNAFSPTRGQRISVSAFVGKDIALQGDSRRSIAEAGFVGFDVQAVKLVRMHPWHVLALRGKLGLVTGNVVHRQFSLGGAADLRGTVAGFQVGNFRTLATAEWRHDFVKDIDAFMIGWRPRGIQGAFFVEGGFVSSDLGKAPRRQDLGVGVGYALRFFMDWLGVLPAMWGIEVAYSPGAPPGRIPAPAPFSQWPQIPFQLTLVGSQSF